MNNQKITYEQLKKIGEEFLKETRPSSERVECMTNIVNSFEDIQRLILAQHEKIESLENQINGGWIKCSDRLPSKEECAEQKSNLFEVTKIISGKFRITDYCLIHTDYKTWHIRENEEVVAWRKKEEPYKESEGT